MDNPFKPKDFTSQTNHLWVCVLCVCRYDISFLYVILTIESKLISLCLISDYSIIINLHIFVNERAELSSISVNSTKEKITKEKICSQINEVKIIGHFEKYDTYKKILVIHNQISERIFPILKYEFNSTKYIEMFFFYFCFWCLFEESYFIVIWFYSTRKIKKRTLLCSFCCMAL